MMSFITIYVGILMIMFFIRKALSPEGNLKFLMDLFIYKSSIILTTINFFMLTSIVRAKVELGIS